MRIENRVYVLESQQNTSDTSDKVHQSRSDNARKEIQGDIVDMETRLKNIEERLVRLQKKSHGFWWLRIFE